MPWNFRYWERKEEEVAKQMAEKKRKEEESSKEPKRKAWLFAFGGYSPKGTLECAGFKTMNGPYKDVEKLEHAMM